MILTVLGNLPQLLRREFRGKRKIFQNVERRVSVKDVIESFGIPHTEIGGIRVNGQESTFSHIVENSEEIEIFAVMAPANVLTPTLLRPKPLKRITFAVDDNVGKLAPLLRLVGLDTTYYPDVSNRKLAQITTQQGRILLSRDKELLSHKVLDFGHLVRETSPKKQLVEIVQLYDLQNSLKPFSRCMECNNLLQDVRKEEIIHRLEPLTIKYYDVFRSCRGCGKIYWPGSHHKKMMTMLNEQLGLPHP